MKAQKKIFRIPYETYLIDSDINAIRYAINSVTIEPDEVGETVYYKLFFEKYKEYQSMNLLKNK